LPGSNQTWQSVEAFGGINGLPVLTVAATVVASVEPLSPKLDSAAVPADSLKPAVHPAAPAAALPATEVAGKPMFRWYVKVK
jgi:hypothetical protein